MDTQTRIENKNKYDPKYDDLIRVQVTKRLPKREIESIVNDFIAQSLTFAVSQIDNEYEVWRQILPGDQPRIKNRKEGMTMAGVIEEDEKDLEERNFISIWEKGKQVYGQFGVDG